MNVLIVDDDPVCLEQLRHLVEQAGHRALVARDGLSALDVLQQNPACHLVVCDWEMPGMNGVELCQAVRFGDFPGYVYIILLTGHSSPREKLVGLSAGADDFMAKPFDPAELTVRLRIGERILSLETRDVAIFALAKLAESRDPETGAHLERMRTYSRVLAWHLSGLPANQGIIDRDYLRMIYITSPLHDIGKVGIPDSILLKPGKLTAEEFEVMKTHTTIGAQTLQAALDQFPGARFLEMARDIACCHHEKFDGQGYPAGLSGQTIPLCARIVALADVYDALTTKRVYKQAFSHDLSKQTILEGAGRHFDPEIVAAFLACEDQFITIARQFAAGSIPPAEDGWAAAMTSDPHAPGILSRAAGAGNSTGRVPVASLIS